MKELQLQMQCAARLRKSLFVFLPLLVLSILFVSRSKPESILHSAEWSFAASILCGQAVVKLIRSMVERGGFHGERVGLLATVILVFGLVPSLVVLSLILLGEPDPPSLLLVRAQFGLFAVGVIAYLLCAFASADDSAQPAIAPRSSQSERA